MHRPTGRHGSWISMMDTSLNDVNSQSTIIATQDYCQVRSQDKIHRNICKLGYEALRTLGGKLSHQMPIAKDWRMLADRLGYTHDQIQTLELKDCPGYHLLHDWGKSKPRSTIAQLELKLHEIERLDVLQVLYRYTRGCFLLPIELQNEIPAHVFLVVAATRNRTLKDLVGEMICNMRSTISLEDLRIVEPPNITWNTTATHLQGHVLVLSMRPRRVPPTEEPNNFDLTSNSGSSSSMSTDTNIAPVDVDQTFVKELPSLPPSHDDRYVIPSCCSTCSSNNQVQTESQCPTTHWPVTTTVTRSRQASRQPSPQSTLLLAHQRHSEAQLNQPPPLFMDNTTNPDNSVTSVSEYLITNLHGWHPHLKKENVLAFISKYQREAGRYIIWNLDSGNFTRALSVIHLNRIKHFQIHYKKNNLGNTEFYLFRNGHRASSLGDLMEFYRNNPLYDTDKAGGNKHIKLVKPVDCKRQCDCMRNRSISVGS